MTDYAEKARNICRPSYSGAVRVDDAQHVEDVEAAPAHFMEKQAMTMRKLPRDLVLILRTEAKNQRTPPIDYVIAEDGGRMVHRPEPDIAMAELLEEAAGKLEELAAENERLRAERVWQPIETAPMDGTKVDLWVVDPLGEGKRIPDCSWGWGQWIGSKGLAAERLGHKATHWIYRPTPPQEKDKEIAALREALRNMFCPRPCNHSPGKRRGRTRSRRFPFRLLRNG